MKNQVYSHPDQTLMQHLMGVASLVIGIIDGKSKLPFLSKKQWKEIGLILALCHDLGKATTYFQEYILSVSEDGIKRNDSLKSHALLSAVCTYFLSKRYLELRKIHHPILPYFAYLAVRRHHGNLKHFFKEIVWDADEHDELMRTQIAALDIDYLQLAFEKITLVLGFSSELAHIFRFTREDLYNWVDEIAIEHKRTTARKQDNFLQEADSLEFYLTFQWMFSVLIDADKSQVGLAEHENFFQRTFISPVIVKEYKQLQKWPATLLNERREKAFQYVDQHPIDIKQHFYSIHLPTGMGKTLLTLHFCMRLKAALQLTGKAPRVIYSLPFLSVIEQNSNVFEKVLNVQYPHVSQNMLVRHHHLSESKYSYVSEEGEFQYDSHEAKLLIEGWNSEVIATTFVQLFQTIFSHKNRHIRRFHQLVDAIIVCDEIQALPHKYWPLVRSMLKQLAERIGCYIIFSSATEPKLLEGENVVSLVPAKEFFQDLERVELEVNVSEKISLEEMLERMVFEEGKRYLFIMNTIQSTKDLYHLLKEHFPEEEIIYLSTHIPPKERSARIKRIQRKEGKFVVSTQLVEAGVDIDLDVVVRDLAPWDSVQQAAGRCNRNGTEKGKVYLFHLAETHGRTYASLIYDQPRLNVTKRLLEDRKILQERDFEEISGRYFAEMKKEPSLEAEKLLRAVKQLVYDGEKRDDLTPISHFSLIDDSLQKLDIFVELDDDARSFWQKYQEILQIKNNWKRKEEFEKLKPDMYQYVIAVSFKQDMNIPPFVSGIHYIAQESLTDYYDENLGFTTEGIGLIW